MGKGDTHTKKHVKKTFVKHDLVIAKKDEGEFYGKVVGILNGNRLRVIDNNGDEIQIIIRGNFSLYWAFNIIIIQFKPQVID